MKKIFAFFILLLAVNTVIAQTNQDTLKALVPYDTFPIGGMRWPVADTLQHMLGMNFSWMGFGGGGSDHSFPNQGQPDSITQAITDPFNRDTANQHIITDPYYLLIAAAYGVDARIYTPGTSGKTEEYSYKWVDTVGVDTLSQYKIPSDGRVVNHQYVATLRNIADPNDAPNSVSDIYGPGGWGQATLDTSHISTFSYELVYFFTQGDTASVSNTDTLYSIEYWIKKADTTGYAFLAADTITKNSYKTLPLAITQAPNHNVNAEILSNWAGIPLSNQYKLQKHTLNLRPYYEDYLTPGTPGYVPLGLSPKVDIRIRTFKKIPMWLRLIRIRDWVGQRLLSGKADVQLDSAINLLLPHHGNNSLKSWTVASEMNYRNFHAWSYLNDLTVHQKAPPLNILAPIDYDLFQRVMHDQTQYDKPYVKSGILLHEWTPFGGEGWRSHWGGPDPITGGPTRNWDYQNYQNFPNTPMPFPFAISGDTVKPFFRGISIIQDYDNYTYHWQRDMMGYNSDAVGGGTGDCQSQYQRAKACYLYDPNHIQPYWLMTQANPFRMSLPKWWVDSIWVIKNDSLGTTAADHWADSIYDAKIINPYLAQSHPGNIISDDSLFDPIWNVRAPTRAESYYQFWSGVEHGMKGYIVNICYDDAIIQNGILFDSIFTNGHDSIIKSQNRTCITIHEPNAITNPYNPSHTHGSNGQYIRYIDLPPGFKQMFPTFRSIITDELTPIATKLSQLKWQGSVSWHKRDSATHSLSLTPIKNLQSKNKSGTIDPDSETYVDIGIHKHPIDSTAIYVSILNRRLWSDPEDTLSTDTRVISFHVDSSKFHPDNASISLWQISDVAHKLRDTIVSVRDTFLFTVKPGQGKLFRIAPAVGLNLGEMTENIFNNGRHIAGIDTNVVANGSNNYGVKQFVAVYARSGKIAVSYPVETPSGAEKRNVGNPIDSLIDMSGIAHNPAVAYNHHNNSIGVTYRMWFPHCDTCNYDTTWICYRRTPYSNPYHFSALKVLDTILSDKLDDNFIAPPSIAPRDTSNIDSININRGEFWVGYNTDAQGVSLLLVDNSGNVTRKINMVIGRDKHYEHFVSIATHVPYDTVRVAFEDDFPPNGTKDPQIYYTDGYLNNTSALVVSDNPAKNISQTLNSCQNHCPQVAIQPLHTSLNIDDPAQPELVSVTWEALNISVTDTPAFYNRYTIVRRRNFFHNWSPFLIFNAGRYSISTYPPTLRILPNLELATSIPHTIFPNSWHDWERLTWNDLALNQITIARYGFYIGPDTSSQSPWVSWYRYHYIEPAQEPAMPNLSFGDLVVQPFLYRDVQQLDDKLFNAKIIRYNFPSNPVLPDKLTGILNAIPPPVMCNKIVRAKITNGQITSIHFDSVRYVPLRGLADSANDPNGFQPVKWDDTTGVRTFPFIVTSGDTLKYQRDFRVGAYSLGDTTAVSDSLKSIYDFLRVRIYLRKFSNRTVRSILDTGMLMKSGFVQTGNLSDSGWKILPITFTDTVYLTMEMSRGDTTNPFQVIRIESHEDDFYDLPSQSSSEESFKKAEPEPSAPPQNILPDAQIKLTVNPNPFEQSTHVALDVSKDVPLNVTLFDVLGHPVLGLYKDYSDKEHYDFTIRKDQLAEGMYILRVQSGSSVLSRKVQLIK